MTITLDLPTEIEQNLVQEANQQELLLSVESLNENCLSNRQLFPVELKHQNS